MKSTGLDWVLKYFEVIFVFKYGLYTLCLPDVDDSITNHASVAACCCCTERMGVVNVEIIRQALDDKPGFVSRENRTCAMELLDIKSAGLSPRRGICNLNRGIL